jgi:PKD repeat protein
MAGGDFRNLGGTWNRSYDMNVGGVVYNADALLNAIVTYDNVSDFSADITCLSGPTTVTFTDYCSPIVTNRMYNQNVAAGVPDNTYGWNFGDGSPVTFANDPSHAYAGTGPYNVILYSTLAGWTHTCIENHNVNIGGSGLPIAAVTPNVSGAMVDFINTSSGATTVSWNFGDGATSSAVSPTHWYSSNGTFVVMLIVSNACGADTLLISVDIVCDFPDASFGYDQPTGTLLTSFTDSSAGDITTYYWNFGDGGTSTSANPYHSYPAYGDYLVTLIVSGPCGNDTLTDTVHITAPVGLTDAASRSLALYPNPTQHHVQVAGLSAGNWELQLTDLSGRVLMRKAAHLSGVEEVELGVENLPNGSYLLVATTGAERRSALLHIAR